MKFIKIILIITVLSLSIVLSAVEVNSISTILQIEETDNDWWLPDNIERDSDRGFYKLSLINPTDKIPILSHGREWNWNELNPEEDVYRFDLIEDKLVELEDTPYAFGLRIMASERRFVPDWVVIKHNPTIVTLSGLPDSGEGDFGYVCPFNENIQAEFHKFLNALKQTDLANHPKIVFAYIHGFSSGSGEELYLKDEDFVTFENECGMTAEIYEQWAKDRIDAWVDVFSGVEPKLMWVGEERALRHEIGDAYDLASSRVVAHALDKGISFRSSIIEAYYGAPLAMPGTTGVSLVQDPYGESDQFFHEMYIRTDLDFPPIAEGRAIGDENENYQGVNDFGCLNPGETGKWCDTLPQRNHRWLMSNILALSMGINLDFIYGYAYNLNIPFSDYVQKLMGKTVDRSPDALAFLNQGYTSKHIDNIWSDVTVKNFERFLYQRDLPGASTVAVEKFYRKRAGGEVGMRNPPWIGDNYFDYIARRTDKATGNDRIYFNVEDRFIYNEAKNILLKVTYKDNSDAVWHIEYDAGQQGILSTPLVAGENDGKWKTVTFEINDALFSNQLPHDQDFSIVTEGDDVTVKYVRIIKMPESQFDLVSHWNFNENSGTTAYDSIANNNGLINGASWTSGIGGNALKFDGVNDYVNMGDANNLDFSDGDDFSISAWFKRNSFNTHDIIVSKRNAFVETSKGYALQIASTDEIVFEVCDKITDTNTDTFSLTSSIKVTDNIWHHIAVVFDDDSADNTKLYIDGVEDTSVIRTGNIHDINHLANAKDFVIGALANTLRPFDGNIDEVRIFNKVLSAGEVKNLYDEFIWIEGDINHDEKVDLLDLIIVAKDFGKTTNFDERADVNGDGVINLLDLIIVARNFGKSL